MPFTDTVSVVSGRNSRASNVSGITGASRSIRNQPVPQSDAFNAGVLSMLKTSTDTGDIGALSFNNARLPHMPTMPRAAHPRRGHNARHSGSSNPIGASSHHHYAPLQTSRVSSSREWDSASNQQRLGSLTSMQSMPPSLPQAHLGIGGLQMPPVLSDEARSYSMTSAPPTAPLPRHRSAASLKSQGHEPRHAHTRPGYPSAAMQENRPPYVYPTRLKRPGYRSPSPALSDTMVQGPPHIVGPPNRRMPMPRPPPQAFNSEDGSDFAEDPRHLNIRPPPRAMSTSPVMGYGEPHRHFPYRNPAVMRSAPGLTTRMNPHWPHGPQPPPHHAQPMLQRPPYAAMLYPLRPGYPMYPHPRYPGDRGPSPIATPEVNPAAHHMFHNAARLARQLPTRTDTPLTGPPSSDPPSSGTAPSSSSPPTPKDQSTLQVAVDPAFIDPALMDLPHSSSEPVLAHQYLRYAEGLEKDMDEPEIEAVHPSVPPSGFVQRVKAMLESKAAADAAAMRDGERDKINNLAYAQEESFVLADDIATNNNLQEIHELAANETPRFTIIEEFHAPVELPASPVRIAELGGSPVQTKRRLTRDLVKAGLAGSSVDNTMMTETSDRASIDMLISHKPGKSEDIALNVELTRRDSLEQVDVPSTPEAVVNDGQGHENVVTASDAGSSPALGQSVANYALGLDTTTTTEESRTEDPFILDADTITLQHQRCKEQTKKSALQQFQHQDRPELEQATETPVSPILAGEEVSRCSAVSPLQTQTLGIEETLQMAADTDMETATTAEDQSESVMSSDQPPPTPRTPKTYSKSVQLIPTTKTDTPSSNRYSLPPDLSTVGDTTMNSNSEMITDVAVRFSLPQTTITVSRPQIIEIPPSSSPVQEPPEPQPLKAALQAPGIKSKRGSVMFADEVAPLKINKKQEEYPASQKPNHARFSASKSIIRRPSPLQEDIETGRASRGMSNDMRFTNTNGSNSGFGSTHLPGLKEESVEEMSITDKRVSDLTGGFQFPLPARIAAVKAMQERRMQQSAEKAKARRTGRHTNRQLAEIRDLPSLNFSRMDLIDKLNEALEVRSSKSMDIIRRREFSQIYCPSPQRPQSTEPLRERYMSFFSKPEDFSSFFDDPIENDDSEIDPEHAPDPDIPVVEVQPSTEVDISGSESRPLSPEDFMNVASQVNRLSIPSVSALTDRLSDILPKMRDLQLDSILTDFEESAELRKDNIRPETVLSTRTSAGFRTLAERAEEIVKNGTHDSTVPTTRLPGSNKDLPALPESVSLDAAVAIATAEQKQAYLSGSVSAPTDLNAQITRPASALLRGKAPTSKDEVQSLLPPEMNPITRHGKRAITISTGSSRPWNQDENYPWNGSKVDVDLTVPSLAHTRRSLTEEVLAERGTKSLDLTNSGAHTNTSKGIDIGSLLEHGATETVTDEQLTGVTTIHQHLRKQSKRSVLGSITKRMGLNNRSECNPTRSIASPTNHSDMHRSQSSQAHRPGERYPTSSLTPPAAFNIDEVRSFFSDDSSDEKDHNASFRKRLTNLKGAGGGKGKTVRIDSSRHSMDDATAYDAGEMNVERLGASSAANTYDGVGMGKTEFRIKRFGEKLRHLVAKGGELIRSWSLRSTTTKPQRQERVRDDWLSDSVYSGV